MENPILQKVQSSYKLVIPQHVENQIRALLREVNGIEWSGILFYTYEGSFETKDLVLTCQDVFPMNIGNSVYTEFEVDADVAAYMVENDLLDCQMGLIHSHHTMSTFFSPTDTATLLSEGSERNNFLSLIVNNARTYSAAITEKETVRIIKRIKGITPFFADEAKEHCCDETEEKTVVYYHMLNIEYPEETTTEAELLKDRVRHLRSQTVQMPSNSNTVFPIKPTKDNLQNVGSDFDADNLPFEDPKLFDDTPYTKLPDKKEDEEEPIPEELIEEVCAKIITGNLLATEMPENIEEALPALNNTWNDFCERNSAGEINSIVDCIIQCAAFTAGVDGGDIALECIGYLEKMFEDKDFYPLEIIIDNFTQYV